MKILLLLVIFSADILTKSVQGPQNSAELSAMVKKSLDSDIETLNLLDRAMAAPAHKPHRANRRLRAKKHAASKERNLFLWGKGSHSDTDDVMLNALTDMQTSIEPEGKLKSNY